MEAFRVAGDNKYVQPHWRRDEPDLGDGFGVGHSYFCQTPDAGAATGVWYQDILRTQIEPLLREYSSGDSSRLKKWLALVEVADDNAGDENEPSSTAHDSEST